MTNGEKVGHNGCPLPLFKVGVDCGDEADVYIVSGDIEFFIFSCQGGEWNKKG